jgi:hypothetical protein
MHPTRINSLTGETMESKPDYMFLVFLSFIYFASLAHIYIYIYIYIYNIFIFYKLFLTNHIKKNYKKKLIFFTINRL